MGGDRCGQRVHADIEGAPRRRERLLGLQDDGELREVVAAHPYQRTGALFPRAGAGMGEGIARFAQ